MHPPHAASQRAVRSIPQETARFPALRVGYCWRGCELIVMNQTSFAGSIQWWVMREGLAAGHARSVCLNRSQEGGDRRRRNWWNARASVPYRRGTTFCLIPCVSNCPDRFPPVGNDAGRSSPFPNATDKERSASVPYRHRSTLPKPRRHPRRRTRVGVEDESGSGSRAAIGRPGGAVGNDRRAFLPVPTPRQGTARRAFPTPSSFHIPTPRRHPCRRDKNTHEPTASQLERAGLQDPVPDCRPSSGACSGRRG